MSSKTNFMKRLRKYTKGGPLLKPPLRAYHDAQKLLCKDPVFRNKIALIFTHLHWVETSYVKDLVIKEITSLHVMGYSYETVWCGVAEFLT